MMTDDRPCVVGTCRCGGYGFVYDEETEQELGRCHDESFPLPDESEGDDDGS